MKNFNKNIKGVTLVSLIITIIVLIILASIGTYSGVEVIKSSKFTKFTTEMKIMQTHVNQLYEKYRDGDNDILNLGKEINTVQSQADIVFTESASGITDQTGYRYFDQETIQGLNIEGVEEEFFINIEKRSVVSYEGIKYEGVTYYTLEQLPNGLYNVDYIPNTNKPEFETSVEEIGDNKWRVSISNIEYEGYIDKWEVKYKLEGQEHWNTSEKLSFIVNQEGNYYIKIANTNTESNEKAVTTKSIFSRFSEELKPMIEQGLKVDLQNINATSFAKKIANKGSVPTKNKNTNIISSSVFDNNYDSYMAFDKQDRTYWCTANGEQNNAYIGYKFEEKKKIMFASFSSYLRNECKEIKLQCSNDNNIWIDASDVITLEANENDNIIKNTKVADGYQYWRIYIISSYSSNYSTVRELQFYEENIYLSKKNIIENIKDTNIISSSIYSSDYDHYKAFDNDKLTYWCTEEGKQNNSYIGCKFEEKQNISYVLFYNGRVQKCKEVKLQCSNDNNTWIDASDVITLDNINAENILLNTKVNDEYQYWRVYIISAYNTSSQVPEIKFYKKENKNLYSNVENVSKDIVALLIELDLTLEKEDVMSKKIDKLENNDNVLSSTIYSKSYDAYMAFDKKSGTYWCTAKGEQNNSYIGYNFGEKQNIFYVSFYSPQNYRGTEVKLQCSNDNSTWIDASDVVNIETADECIIKSNIKNEGYQYWRILIISAYDSNYTGISEIEFYGI